MRSLTLDPELAWGPQTLVVSHESRTISCFWRTVTRHTRLVWRPRYPLPRLHVAVNPAEPNMPIPRTYRPPEPRRDVKPVILAYGGMDQLTIYFVLR